jgi:hypothetical protein
MFQHLRTDVFPRTFANRATLEERKEDDVTGTYRHVTGERIRKSDFENAFAISVDASSLS